MAHQYHVVLCWQVPWCDTCSMCLSCSLAWYLLLEVWFSESLLNFSHFNLVAYTENSTAYTFTNYQLNGQFLYSSTICMLHYDPQHVSSSTLLIVRRTNCITAASGIVTLCKQQYSVQVESGLSPLSTCILYCCLQRVTIPEAVVIQIVLLRMSSMLLETCWGL